jgi:hypothetical protein
MVQAVTGQITFNQYLNRDDSRHQPTQVNIKFSHVELPIMSTSQTPVLITTDTMEWYKIGFGTIRAFEMRINIKENQSRTYEELFLKGEVTGMYQFNVVISNLYREAGYTGGANPWRQDQIRHHYLMKLPGERLREETLRGKIQAWINQQHLDNPNQPIDTYPTLQAVMNRTEQLSSVHPLPKKSRKIAYPNYSIT